MTNLMAGADFTQSSQLFGCIHCGAPVQQAGYACEECAEDQLPAECQRREGDQILLLRNRAFKHEGLRAQQDAEEKPILLRPKAQPEGNDPHDERTKMLNAAADYINKALVFSKTAEGHQFWYGVIRMLREKGWEMAPANQKKKK